MNEFNRRRFLRGAAVLAIASSIGVPVVMTTGCNGVSIAQDIVNWTPALKSTAATAAATATILLPADAVLIAAALAGFNAAANLVSAEAQAYLANPGQTALQALQTGVITFQQQINSTLLSAAKIVNPQSQQVVTAALNGVATVINSIFALILQIKGNTVSAVAAAGQKNATSSVYPIILGHPYSTQSVKMVMEHYDVSFAEATGMYVRGLDSIQEAGF